MNPNKTKGKVILASAGPGDPDLITIKAVEYLKQADVVLTDRLVSEEILNRYVQPDTEIIHVGKQCRRGVSTPQETINELLVHYALSKKLVVRLKGGVVSIFSNIKDELEALVANSIDYEIIPGVTAALGAAAYAGIPLTARSFANSVRFVTYYKSDIVKEKYWKELANTNDTLVFYMSSETLDKVIEKLIRYNIGSEKLLAVIEQASTPFQKVYTSNLYEYEKTLRGKLFVSPSIVIIGKVVSLHSQFAWAGITASSEHYFKPVKDVTESIKLSA
jgi:uroporphyrin-III C-methyltransferase/precorrin-2 dehydrogenase/sirohydrochlorin ferrochelatase/uroporphyrin-III C-methyltransferase